jgi:hypothetical protein
VLVTWHAEVDVFADSQRSRIRTCQTLSAGDGTFSVKAWRAPPYVIGSVQATFRAYLPGYRMDPAISPVEHAGQAQQQLVLYAADSATASRPVTPSFVNVADCVVELRSD